MAEFNQATAVSQAGYLCPKHLVTEPQLGGSDMGVHFPLFVGTVVGLGTGTCILGFIHVWGSQRVPGMAAGLSFFFFSHPSGKCDGCKHLHPRGLPVHEREKH